jgi:uncharacterized membrane protein
VGRYVSLVAGGVLMACGFLRGSLSGLVLMALGGALAYRGASGRCALYKAMGMSTADTRVRPGGVAAMRGARIDECVTIMRPREELYLYWRDLSNLPSIMHHLESVRTIGNGRSHWVAKGPMGTSFEWDAEIITERENELIGWKSLEGSSVDTAGSVHFMPAAGGKGTDLCVSLKYDPPAGKVGIAIAELLGQSPADEVREDLQRFKMAMEAQSVPQTSR